MKILDPKDMLLLRPYQQRIIDAARVSMIENKRIMIYAPGGAGKSVIIAYMAYNAAKKNLKTIVLTHRQEILAQNFKKMDMLGVDVQLINSKTKKIKNVNAFCAMTQTVVARCKRKIEWSEWLSQIDFIIIDEAHRQDSDDLQKIFHPNAWVVGLSATPLRSGNMNQLGGFYSKIISEVLTEDIIKLSYLTPSTNYAFQAPKLDTVGIDRGTGDYVQKQLQRAFRKPERYAGVIDNYKRICPGTKTLVFTTGGDHCVDLCVKFNEAGVRAKYLLSEVRYTDREYSGERTQLLKDFAEGKFEVLVNIYVLDTGVDIPNLETVILDFSTKSYARYMQAVSRGSRIYPGKGHFNVLDFGENIKNFGIYEGQPIMSLWHNKGGSGVPPMKICPADKKDNNQRSGCNRLIPVSMTDCPFCKFHFETDKEVYEVELAKIIKEEEEDMSSIPRYVANMVLRGKSTNWILINICIKNSDNPKKAFLEAIKYIRTKNGDRVSPQYWYFFKNQILKDKLKK